MVVLDRERFRGKIIKAKSICTSFYLTNFNLQPPLHFDQRKESENDKEVLHNKLSQNQLERMLCSLQTAKYNFTISQPETRILLW